MMIEAWKAHELTIAGVKSFTNAASWPTRQELN
jgi:hypothetical protein